MRRIFIFLFGILFCFQIISADAGHESDGTNYSTDGVLAYELNRHGKDGALFLDPCFIPKLENMDGQILLDAGCGAGPWSIYAAKNGAMAYGIDIQEGMIERATAGAKDEGVQNQTHFLVGSVSEIPYSDDFFDKAISINVGCNLPENIFSEHFHEINRTLKSGGALIITAPASFGVLFTNGSDSVSIRRKIDTALLAVGDAKSSGLISQELNKLDEVLRATFAFRNGGLTLIENENELIEGECIWRKIPGLAVPNYYHSEQSYVDAILSSDFSIETIDRLRFSSAEEWQEYSSDLGKEYIDYHPFVVFHLRKKGSVTLFL